jgi:beta-lactamase class D
MLLQRIFLVFAMLAIAPAWALEFHESPAVADIFSKAKVSGTFVLYDPSVQRLVGHDRKRAETRFIPASTFKIPNSLIGLSTGAVGSVDEVFYHDDGKPKFLKSWEHDMGLREAIKTSNVFAYRELARRIGLKRMQDNIAALDFGNADIGKTVDTFWLEGPLKISAVEQAVFLVRLAQGQLPYPASVQAAVREIATLETGDDWTLYGKTGWAAKDKPGIGWFVGWVEQGGKPYGFALNIDVPEDDGSSALSAALSKRTEVAKASLRALGLMQAIRK